MTEQQLAAMRQALEALRRADGFITNGIQLGFIRMPDADTPDPAHETPGMVRAAINAITAIEQAEKQQDLAYREAVSLATWLFKKHFSHEEHYSSGRVVWEPCDTTAGVISQIDNMVCGLVMPKVEQAETAQGQESEYCDPSLSVYKLAEMVMSDCGHSANNQRLLDRIADRIQRHVAANTPPYVATPLAAQPAPEQKEDLYELAKQADNWGQP